MIADALLAFFGVAAFGLVLEGLLWLGNRMEMADDERDGWCL